MTYMFILKWQKYIQNIYIRIYTLLTTLSGGPNTGSTLTVKNKAFDVIYVKKHEENTHNAVTCTLNTNFQMRTCFVSILDIHTFYPRTLKTLH